MHSSRPRAEYQRLLARCVLLSGALLLLIAFGAFTARPVTPYLSSTSNAWHVSRASRTCEPGAEGVGEITAAVLQPKPLQLSPGERTPLPDPQVPFLMLPRLLHTHYFRPPPLR